MIIAADRELIIGKVYPPNSGCAYDVDGGLHYNIPPFLVLRVATKEEYEQMCIVNTGKKPIEIPGHDHYYQVSVD